MDEDFENHIPVINLQLSQGLSELRVKVVAYAEGGFVETRIERVKVQKPEAPKNVCVARPFYRFKPIADTISLCIEDVKLASPLDDNCWQAYECPFRKVLVYGKIDVLNLITREGKTIYKFLVDDGTGSIVASLNITQKTKIAVSSQFGKLTMEKNKLKHRRSTGINIRGQFLHPDSEENLAILKNIAVLHNRVSKNIQHQRKEFELGPVNEKALISAWLYLNQNKEVQLGVFDLWLNDHIEVAWKQHLNNLYLKEYLKTPSVPTTKQ